MGISFALMWQLYSGDSVNYNFIYFLLMVFSFLSGLTIFSVPYVAMGYEMSDDFHERTRHYGYLTIHWSIGLGNCTLVLGN